MAYILLLDFGSTFTKAVLVDDRRRAVRFSTTVPSTVATDAAVGLRQCLDRVAAEIGPAAVAGATKLASSSAAGGLRMAVCGLTRSLSVSAGRNASFGAGARVVHVAVGELQGDDLTAIAERRAEIVLLCGGYEGGNEDILIHNARVLAASSLTCPVIFAGNSGAADEFRRIMRRHHREFYAVANLMPQVGVLSAAQAEATVRSIFMERIVDMKGLSGVRAMLGEIAMPTPAAVLAAGELLAQGTGRRAGLGDLLIVDVGGATTDVHSCALERVHSGARFLGAGEPYAKRTVEGDLGMRESCGALCQEVGHRVIAEAAGMSPAQVAEAVARRMRQVDYLAEQECESRLDQVIAQAAVRLATRRHAGRVERVAASNCPRIQRGKNLRAVTLVLGTGGVIVHSPDPARVLREALADPRTEPDLLLPGTAEMFVDADYLLFAAGLLRRLDADLAFDVLRASLRTA